MIEIFATAIEKPGLESQHSRKRLFFHIKISNSLTIKFKILLSLKIQTFI